MWRSFSRHSLGFWPPTFYAVIIMPRDRQAFSRTFSRLSLLLSSSSCGSPSSVVSARSMAALSSLHGLRGSAFLEVFTRLTKRIIRSRRKICQAHFQRATMKKIVYLDNLMKTAFSFNRAQVMLFVGVFCGCSHCVCCHGSSCRNFRSLSSFSSSLTCRRLNIIL